MWHNAGSCRALSYHSDAAPGTWKKEPGEEVTLGSFLRKYANTLTMPAGQSSLDRQPGVSC
jgi:hypothetical protein